MILCARRVGFPYEERESGKYSFAMTVDLLTILCVITTVAAVEGKCLDLSLWCVKVFSLYLGGRWSRRCFFSQLAHNGNTISWCGYKCSCLCCCVLGDENSHTWITRNLQFICQGIGGSPRMLYLSSYSTAQWCRRTGSKLTHFALWLTGKNVFRIPDNIKLMSFSETLSLPVSITY